MNEFKVIENKSEWPTDEIMPLLRFAYRIVKPEFYRATPVMPIRLVKTRRNTWRMKWTLNGATLAFAAPDKGHLPTRVAVQCTTMYEVVVATAAWVFTCLAGRASNASTMTAFAVREFRENGGAKVIARIEAIRQRKVDRKGEDFAKQVFGDMERKTYAYKLSKLEGLEKVWQRKLKLATTKLAKLNRRKAALRAAETRRNACEVEPLHLP